MSRNRRAPPAIHVAWDELMEAADGTFSTTLRVRVSGYWQNGRPATVGVVIRTGGGEPGNHHMDLTDGEGAAALTRLAAGCHYAINVTAGSKETEKLLVVPKKKTPADTELGETLAKTALAKAKTDLHKAESELKATSELPKPKAASVSAQKRGAGGRYVVVVTVLSQDGVGVPDAELEVYNGAEKLNVPRTAENGTSAFTYNFDGPEKILTIGVVGASIQTRVQLLGPVQQPQHPNQERREA